MNKNCAACGLDYSSADSADGPAVFAIFIVGTLAVAIAFIARFSWGAPIWLAFLISSISAALLTAALLRPLKAILIALQYRYKAKEGSQTSGVKPSHRQDSPNTPDNEG